jgi:hypothetical protein
MQRIHYKIRTAEWTVDSSSDARTELLELDTQLSLNQGSDCARITLHAPPAAQPGLLEEAVGAAASAIGLGGEDGQEPFSVQVRGNAIKHGDAITVELTADDQTATVMTARVQSIRSSFGQTSIAGVTGKQTLACSRVSQVYENQTLGQIVKDLADQAGIETGDVDDGSTYSYFVVQDSKNVFQHVRELAMRDGLDVYFDPDNKLTLKKFDKTSADHVLSYGVHILGLKLNNRQPTSEHVFAYAESPSSKQGSSTWHWLAKDLSPSRGEVGDGRRASSFYDGALRTKDAAELLATSKLGALVDQSAGGTLKVLGNPQVKLGDAIEIQGAPKPEINGLFKVTSVRHVFNKRDGFVTFIGFSGSGGAESAGGLLAGAAAQIAGAF